MLCKYGCTGMQWCQIWQRAPSCTFDWFAFANRRVCQHCFGCQFWPSATHVWTSCDRFVAGSAKLRLNWTTTSQSEAQQSIVTSKAGAALHLKCNSLSTAIDPNGKPLGGALCTKTATLGRLRKPLKWSWCSSQYLSKAVHLFERLPLVGWQCCGLQD